MNPSKIDIVERMSCEKIDLGFNIRSNYFNGGLWHMYFITTFRMIYNINYGIYINDEWLNITINFI